MPTKKYVSLDKLSLYDEKIKKYLADADAAALQSAKDYADGLASNYDAAGSAASAQAAAIDAAKTETTTQVNALANGAVKANADAITAIKDDANVDSFADVVAELAKKQNTGDYATKAEAQAMADGKDAAIQAAQNAADAAQQAADKAQGEVDDLEILVGTLPEGTTATSVVDYVNVKTSGIATDAALGELNNQVAGLQTTVQGISEDHLKGADKTELEGKINLKADQSALEQEIADREGAVSGLQTQINTIMNNPDAEGAINSINEFTQYIADHGEIADGFRTDIDKNKDDIAAEVKRAGEAESALAGRLDTLEAIDHEAYVDADDALKGELTTEIGKKADASALTEAVEALEGADADQVERIAALEAKFGEGDGNVEDMIEEAKQAAIDAAADDATAKANAALADAKTDSANKDAVVLAEAQQSVSAVQANLDAHTGNGDIHVTAEQKTAWSTAADKAHEHANASVINGITAENVTTWNTVTSKAAQSDLTAATDRITAIETWHANFVEVSEQEINDLFTA